MKFSSVVVVITIVLVAGSAASGALPVRGATTDGGAAVARAGSGATELALISSLDARDELLEVGTGGEEGGATAHDPTLMFLASFAVPGSR